MAMLPGDVEEGRRDDVGPLGAVGADEPLDDPLLAPARERVVAVLGESEIVHGIVRAVTEPDDARIEDTRRLLHLARAQHAERTATLRADGVLPALAARRARNDDAHAVGKAQGGEEPVMLVVRMGAGVHEGDDALQAAEGTLEAQQGGGALLPGNTLMVS